MALKGVRKSTKSPPILSHEFVIQNHADIISCVAMVFVLGLMFQVTAPWAATFVTLSHNATAYEDLQYDSYPGMLYTNGIKDLGTIFFYSLIAIVVQAVIQEYILDKLSKKLHLSKLKHSKFNESGQLFVFSALSAAWGTNIIIKDNILNEISSLWVGYPSEHGHISFQAKFFFVIQLSYWLHCFPELYFGKVKRDDIFRRVQYASLYLLFISAAYFMNFTRVGVILLVLRFAEEAVLHLCRLFHFAEKYTYSSSGYQLWNILFVVSRLFSFILTILTFHYGLATLDNQELDFETGNFNTSLIRLNVLIAICMSQAYLMWQFIHFHLRRSRERQAAAPKASKGTKAKDTKNKGKGKKENKDKRDAEFRNLTEADQNTRRRK